MIELNRKKIYVSAAAAGIGRATAILAAKRGATVYATDIDGDGLSSLADLGMKTEVLDGTDMMAVEAYFDREPAFDGILNAVGFVHQGSLAECEPDMWRKSFTINVDSLYFVLRAAIPKMAENGGGSIVNIASVVSSLKGFVNRFAYGATKAAVIGVTKSIAVDYMNKGIRSNAICPGTIESPSLQQRMDELGKTMGGYEAARRAFIARQPIGRLGKPEEVAELAAYLLSDAAAFTTGQTHVIDGGILA